jgi:predicted transcriptional regulator
MESSKQARISQYCRSDVRIGGELLTVSSVRETRYISCNDRMSSSTEGCRVSSIPIWEPYFANGNERCTDLGQCCYVMISSRK